MGQDKASLCETVMYEYNREQDGTLLRAAMISALGVVDGKGLALASVKSSLIPHSTECIYNK